MLSFFSFRISIENYPITQLGSKRRETVWSLSFVGAGCLRGAVPSTRGPEWTNQWCV
ncbi:hypothetical protein CP10743SC13_0992, partial [Chlamydia psittaci 10_743_SC13]